MVDDMTPNDIYATIQATPRPGTTLLQCAEDLLEELGNEELFQRVLAIGYMLWQRFKANWTKKQLNPYEPSSVRKVAEKFGVSSSRIMDLQRGEAITREQTRMKKMLKAEKKEEGEEKKRKSRSKSRTPTPQASTSQQWPHKTRSLWDHRLSVLSGPPRFPKGNTFEKLKIHK